MTERRGRASADPGRQPPISHPAVAASLIAVLLVIAAATGISLATRSNPARPAPPRAGEGAPSGPATSGTPSTGTHRTGARGTGSHPSRSAGSSPGRRPTQNRHHDLTPHQRRAEALATMHRLESHEPDHAISVAAVNTATGARFTAGANRGMWTASAYKLLVLETLLLQNGGPLSGSEAAEAVPMIENSDNKAGYSLFLAAGGNEGLENALRRFGMTHTIPGATDPTFTRTSAADFLQLVRNLVGPGPLTPSAQAYAKNLMRDVEDDQRWGVGVVADKGTVFYNKNGWLDIEATNPPGETDHGLWAVASVGIVTVQGQQLLMSVFTQHQPDFGAGVNLVEQLAKAIAPAVLR